MNTPIYAQIVPVLKSLNIPFTDPCSPDYTGDCTVCDDGVDPITITSVVVTNLDNNPDEFSVTVNWVDGTGATQSTVSNVVMTVDNQTATQVPFSGTACNMVATNVQDALCELVANDAANYTQINTGNVPATLVDPTGTTYVDGDMVVQPYDNGVVLSTLSGTTWTNTLIETPTICDELATLDATEDLVSGDRVLTADCKLKAFTKPCPEVEMFGATGPIASPGAGLLITDITDQSQVDAWIADYRVENPLCGDSTNFSYTTFCRIRDQFTNLFISNAASSFFSLQIGGVDVLTGVTQADVDAAILADDFSTIEASINTAIAAQGLTVSNFQYIAASGVNPYSTNFFLNSDGLQEVTNLAVTGVGAGESVIYNCNTDGDYYVFNAVGTTNTLVEAPLSSLDVSPCINPKTSQPFLNSTTVQGAVCELANAIANVGIRDNADGSFTFLNPLDDTGVRIETYGNHRVYNIGTPCPASAPTGPMLDSTTTVTAMDGTFSLGESYANIYDGCTYYYTWNGTGWDITTEDTSSCCICDEQLISDLPGNPDPTDYDAVSAAILDNVGDCPAGSTWVSCTEVPSFITGTPAVAGTFTIFTVAAGDFVVIPTASFPLSTVGIVNGVETPIVIQTSSGGNEYLVQGALPDLTEVSLESTQDRTDCYIYTYQGGTNVQLTEQPSVAAVPPSITEMCDPANSDAVVYILVDTDRNFTYQNADNTPWTGNPLTLEKCCCGDSPNTQDLTSISWRIDGNEIGLDYIDENQDTTSESITCEEFKTFLASCPDTHSIKVLNPDGTDKSCPLIFPFTLTDATEVTSQAELDTWVNTNRVGYTWEDATCSYVNTTGENLKDITTGEWICDISNDCCRITSTASFTAATPTIRVIDNTTGQIIFNGSNGSIITYDYVGNAALALNGTGVQISGFGLSEPTVAEIRFTLNSIINPVESCNSVTQIRSNITDFDTQNSSNRSSTLFDYDNYFYFNVGNRMQNTTGIEWEAIVPNDNGALVGVVQTEGVQNYGSDFGLVISNIGTVAETGEAIGFQIFTWTHEMAKKCYLSNTGMSVYRYEDTSSNTVLESDIVCTPFQTQTKIN